MTLQKSLYLDAHALQVRFVVMHYDKVVHVAGIVLFLQAVLHKFVQLVQVDVGAELTGQISNRQTHAGCWVQYVGGINDVAQQRQSWLACNALEQ